MRMLFFLDTVYLAPMLVGQWYRMACSIFSCFILFVLLYNIALKQAMCEATEITGYEGFVPCSGATRRRMNVTSTIRRPINEQCTEVDVQWEEFYGPSEGKLDYNSSYDDIIDYGIL